MSEIISGGFRTISGVAIEQPYPVQLAGVGSGIRIGVHSGFDNSPGIDVFVVGFSGGVTTSVSGDVVLVISGGTIQVSGTVRSLVSGDFVFTSGGGSPNISGGVTVSGGVQVSGTVVVAGNPFQAIGWTSGLDNKIAINVFIVSGSVVTTAGLSLISGGVTVSGGVQVSGAVQVSGTIYIITSGTAISVGSGSFLPVTVLSGSVAALSGLNIIVASLGATISGGVTVSGSVQVSGTITSLFNSGIITNVASGTVGLFEWPTYALISYWSGAVGKGIIGIYNAGGAAAQSGQEIALIRLELGIIASGLYNRFDLIQGSGNISGTAGTVVAHRFADTASMGSGWVDGATQVSGNVMATLHSTIAESNSSGIMHNYVREWVFDKAPRASSGQELWVRMVSGIGIGTARLEWVERYP